jgi:exosortase family protein XrtF
MEQLLQQYRSATPRNRFLLKVAALAVLWKGIEITGLDALVHPWVTALLVDQGAWLLEAVGYQTTVSLEHDLTYLSINGQRSVHVADACNGLTTLLLFTGFIVLTKGSLIGKAVFSIIGTVVLHLANVVRVAALAHGYIYYRVNFDFNHKYLYAMLVYALIFLLWMCWVLINRPQAKTALQ